MGEALEHLYAYRFASSLTEQRGLSLAASSTDESGHPFLDARARDPRQLALLLRSVSDVVRARYHIPAAMLQRILAESDPVFTVSRDLLRVEGFSSCCGVYARADFDAHAFDGAELSPGSTNVDFHEPLRAALGRVRSGDDTRLSVSEAGVDVEVTEGQASTRVSERRVRLPLRWVRSFLEVQVVQARMEKSAELSAVNALRFLRALPKTGRTADAAWAVPSGNGLRLTSAPSKEAVRLAGFGRLRVLEPMLASARRVSVYADPRTAASAWIVEWPYAQFTLVLSPDTWRGFSGEGQALHLLDKEPKHVAHVRAQLCWQSELTIESVAQAAGLQSAQALEALTQLGAWGAVGFDVARGRWFHRVLPVDLARASALIERQQPRLQAARELLEADAVRITEQRDEHVRAEVTSAGVIHRVEVNGDDARCTCPWSIKHGNERGMCKHALAARIAVDEESA